MADIKELQTLANTLKTENEDLSNQIQAIVTADNYLEAISMQKEITELTKKNEYLKKTLNNLQNGIDITKKSDKAIEPKKEK
jgi:FtsZ-binding cell division protein ZapB